MPESIIKFGKISKKILLPIFLAILEVTFIIINRYFKEEHRNVIFQMYTFSIGQMLIKVLPCILKIALNDIKKSKLAGQINQNKWKHYSLLSLLYIGNSAIVTVVEYFFSKWVGTKNEYNEGNIIKSRDFIIMSIEMIIMIFVSIWLLKYKYYKHHIISVIIYMIFGILSEILIGEYTFEDKRALIVKLIRVLGCAVDAIYYCFQKYLMDKFYYPYWNIAFIPGFLLFILTTIFLIIMLTDPLKANSEKVVIKDFYLYFTQDAGPTVGKILIHLVLHIIMCPLVILTIYYFIQLIALMIHLEIIELNFCGLNRFTKQNIDLRGIDDLINEDRDSTVGLNSFDINRDYTIENPENNENPVEMCEQMQEG